MSSSGVIIIDDNILLCDLLREVVNQNSSVGCLGAAYTLLEGRKLCDEMKPSIVVMDIDLPDGDGWEFVNWATNQFTRPPRIVIMSGRQDERTLVNATHYPLAGFVDKRTAGKIDWIKSVDSVAKGKVYFSTSILDAIRRLRNDTHSWEKLLSDRELELLPLLAAGYTDDAIALTFKLQPISIKTYRRRIRVKLNLKSTVELILWCFEKGFLQKPIPHVDF